MKKQKPFIYKCSSCGHEEPKWLGRCPECGEWNTLIETAAVNEKSLKAGGRSDAKNGLPQTLPLSAVDPMEGSRIASGIGELDRVLGGGIMKRSAVLVGGEPGIGKSTLLLQLAAMAQTKGRVLYVSGEESAGQLRLRADRIGLTTRKNNMERIEILCTGSLEEIEIVLNSINPVLVLIDSAQTLFSADGGSAPGGVNQMKYCSFELTSWVKEHDASLFLTAHVTKEGLIAGPKTLEHIVDTVLYFEQNDKASGFGGTLDCRFLRAAKNRFGSVDEIGIFTMGEQGLSPVEDTGRLFLVRREGELPAGVATAAVLEGSRTILVEIQALTIPAKGTISRVFSDKIDSGRVSRVSAALEKHLGLRLSDQDLYVNAAGGIRITEVGVELALACALYSARTGLPLPVDLAIAGELSLTGEIRPVRRLVSRVKTAASLGFGSFLGPSPELQPQFEANQAAPGLRSANNIKSAIKLIYGEKK
uniref:DNA repair protein RadA n=1 Tax=uncultured bacterium contig00004 TaxID=1181496 RepID=A0A806KAF7_9BACT|nr:DNA repair protein RadA [uncultured bacterium contig00004]